MTFSSAVLLAPLGPMSHGELTGRDGEGDVAQDLPAVQPDADRRPAAAGPAAGCARPSQVFRGNRALVTAL